MTFASGPWFEALVAALNRQPDLDRALAGLGADAGVVVEAGPGFPREVAAYGHNAGGRVEARGATVAGTQVDVSGAVARRMAFSAGVIPAVLDGQGRVLDLGRRSRFVCYAAEDNNGCRHPRILTCDGRPQIITREKTGGSEVRMLHGHVHWDFGAAQDCLLGMSV